MYTKIIKGESRMENQENTQPSTNQERDIMDGGFAVVDREKLIEEETRYITPWYKNFINVFFAPRKMMEDCFYEEPPKGMGIAIAGSVLFMLLYLILSMLNPATKEMLYNTLRMQGIAEDMISQTYIVSQIGGIVAGVIGVFISGLITAVLLKLLTLITKDKAKFSVLYTVSLLSIMVSSALLFIDRIIGNLIPTQNIVMGATVFLAADALTTNPVLYTIASVFTIPSLYAIVILIIGYAVAAGASIKKSAIAIIIMQVITTAASVALISAAMSLQSGMMNAAM